MSVLHRSYSSGFLHGHCSNSMIASLSVMDGQITLKDTDIIDNFPPTTNQNAARLMQIHLTMSFTCMGGWPMNVMSYVTCAVPFSGRGQLAKAKSQRTHDAII